MNKNTIKNEVMPHFFFSSRKKFGIIVGGKFYKKESLYHGIKTN